MRLLFVLIISVSIVALSMSGCGRSFRSSGFVDEPGSASVLPRQIPQQVAVLSFGGDPGVAARATRVFREGLFELGFEIVNPDSIPSEGKTALDNRIPEVSPSLLEVYREAGAKGLFVGGVERQTSRHRVKTGLQIKLILTDNREVIWRGMENDPKISLHDMDPLRSVERSVQRLLKTLGRDIKDLTKRNMKAAKKAAKNVADQQE